MPRRRGSWWPGSPSRRSPEGSCSVKRLATSTISMIMYPAMSHDGITANGLVREFKGGIRAVNGIELQVQPNEIYSFLGPNGAGKSTTVHVITTLLPPTAGSATVAGFDVSKQGPEVRRRIGAALQEAALDAFLTGREHFELQGGLHGLTRSERRGRAVELLERVGLTE